MDQRDSCCPWLLSGEPTAKGTGLEVSVGKEDPVEFDSSLLLHSDMMGVAQVGGECQKAKETKAVRILVQASSEIPLPSLSLCSWSCQGTMAH